MTFSPERKSRAPALALTSMLDVIFLLLCFFVTVSVFSQWESEISIKLPTAKTADQQERLPGEIIVNIAKDGVIHVNAAVMKIPDLRERLSRIAKFYPGQPVIVRADRETKYEALVEVVDACREAGVWNFSLATERDVSK